MRNQPTNPPTSADEARPTTAPPAAEAIGQDIFCQDCGYNLRGLTSDRCPECGGSLDTIRAAASVIPWVYRHEIGRFRAYWKTVSLAMSRRRSFCEEMARPINFKDCQRFRWVTILHVYVSILIAMFLAAPTKPFRDRIFDEAYWGVWPVMVIHVWLLLYLLAATGAPSYLFHPKSIPVVLQNRAIALSYYACAPLAVLALPILALGAGLMLSTHHTLGIGLVMFGAFVTPLPILAWWSNLLRLAGRVMPGRRRSQLAVALGIPLLWIISALLVSALLLVFTAGIALIVYLVV